MSDFSIELLDGEQTSPIRRGLIRIGAFHERFEVSLEYWSPQRYEAQWSEALERLRSGRGHAAFITSITDPVTANFVFCWAAYREGDEVYFQEHVLMLDALERPFDERQPWVHLVQRETEDEDGQRISEWRLHWPVARGGDRSPPA